MSLRLEVMKCFRALHKTRKLIFHGDQRALSITREKINEEFQKNKTINDINKIKELIAMGLEVERELRTTVIQAVEVSPGHYKARILPDTHKLDSPEYKGWCDDDNQQSDQTNNSNKCCKK